MGRIEDSANRRNCLVGRLSPQWGKGINVKGFTFSHGGNESDKKDCGFVKEYWEEYSGKRREDVELEGNEDGIG